MASHKTCKLTTVPCEWRAKIENPVADGLNTAAKGELYQPDGVAITVGVEPYRLEKLTW